MAIIKNQEEREVAMLEKVEKEIRSHERRERIHHMIMGGLTLLAVATYFAGHCAGKRHACHCKHKL